MKIVTWLAGAAIALTALSAADTASAQSSDTLKIGFLATFTGPGGVIGQHIYDGFMLAMDHAGGKLGGLPTEVLKADDQLKPEIGLEKAKAFIERDKVNFITGIVFTNVMMAVYKPIMQSGTILVGSNSGPATIAGELCNRDFFNAGFQMDTVDESMGRYLTEKDVKEVVTLAPNYVAGRDAIASFKRMYKGKVALELYTGLDQVDYSAELAQLKASGVHDVYVFYPGGFGINFLKQFYQAGLRDSVHVYSKGTSDWTSIAAQGPAAVGSYEFVHWNADLDNPANKRFVEDYKKKYNYPPSAYSDQGYDAAQVIDAAVKAVHGDLKNKDALLTALHTVKIDSPRGPFAFNTNQFPIHNQYLVETVMGKDGQPTIITTSFAYKNVGDSHADKCSLK